jgi:hypothetical protein
VDILVGCECSGHVREAFRALGHNAWSCDLGPAWDGSPCHFQGDVREVATAYRWDMLIAHPPCTYLSNSGVRWLWLPDGSKNEPRWAAMREGAALFRFLLELDTIPLRVIENPVIHKYAVEEIGARHSQTIQPWQFGHTACKRTALWLRGVPPLQPTQIVGPPPSANSMDRATRAVWHACHLAPPSPDRQAIRSITYTGIAAAMAAQWGTLQ